MSRYRGPVCRICRREGQKLFLKGQRCNGPKCAIEKKAYPPGQFGDSTQRRRRISDYGMQLREKQRLRAIYGVLEKPFRKYVMEAERMEGVAGENLLKLLESRLDSVLVRASLASSRAEARQLIAHGHVTVNGRKVTIKSFRMRPGDVVGVRERSREIQPIAGAVASAGGRPSLPWLQADPENRTATMLSLPERADIDVDIDEQTIIEFYSR
ncbi:MAG: 30S ribosomal protein S4 [Armatimonadetes bacterium]|nr:30S ribosomal protein S4 [Armatimonadota bacterium]